VDGKVTVTLTTDADGFITGMTQTPTGLRRGNLWHKTET
jgi:hypothetical protein